MTQRTWENSEANRLRELDEYIEIQYAEREGEHGAHSSREGALIMALHRAQDIFGYISDELQIHIAGKLAIPVSQVYGVVTFYSFFNTKPKGKYKISVCMGTACFVRGAQGVLDKLKEELKISEGETTEDGMFSLDSLRCVGACGLAPVVSVNGQVYGRVSPGDVTEILEKILAEDDNG